jgi:pentatricopeptide repeat protein
MRLFGRELETRRIDSLLDSARAGRSGVLILRGAPGVGKTALLRYASERGEGMTVLRARGLEVEALLAFSGLADLFRPVLDRLDEIPPPQSAALAAALGVGSPVSGDRFVVSVATLSLLAAAAEERPVLAVVDDSQWLDVGSREAVFFAARRVEAERVAMIIATLTPEPSIDSTGLAELVVSDLERPAARELLEERAGHSIAPKVLEQLMEATGGNPLGLREFSGALTEAQLRGGEEIGEQLPAAAGVERAFLRRVGLLSAETRGGLVVVAASSGVTNTISAACEVLGFAPTCLEAAEEAGVIQVEADRIVFTHPLLRAAVYHAAPTGVRDRAHRALADALAARAEAGDSKRPGPSFVERRAWQLAAATHEPDESVASALQAAASQARSRAGHAAAAAGLERAAQLTPSGSIRATRLVEAAQEWNLAGRADTAAGLLDEAQTLAGNPGLPAATQHLRGHIEMGRGHFAFASKLLESEAAAAADSDPEAAAFMLLDAAVSASTSGSLREAVRLARKAWRLAEPLGGYAAAAAQAILGGERAFHGEPLTQEDRSAVIDAAILLTNMQPPSPIVAVVPVVLIAFEEYERAKTLLDGFCDSGRALGSPTVLVPVLCLRSDLEFRTGEWIAAYADASESLRLARETRNFTFHSLAFLARIEAGRGLATECRAHAAEALEQAKRDRIGATETYATWALGLLAVGLGRISEAVGHLEHAAELVEKHEMRHPVEVPWAQDLIEAYVRSGRIDEAESVLEQLQGQAETTQLNSALAAAARSRGLLADEQSFAAEFEHALSSHAKVPTPFERARTELCYGERLRRSRRRSDARPHLRAALRTFDRLDATPWIARARVELEATGEVGRPAREDGLRGLTPQELQLALIVSRGATNKEASAALFISSKTVEAHLHRIYVKLGIRSRTDLARHLAREHVLD